MNRISLLLVRASFVANYIECLDKLELPVDQLLAEQGLNRSHFDSPSNFVLENSIYRLLAQANQLQPDGLLGVKMTELIPINSYGDLFVEMMQQTTLISALNLFIKNMKTVSSCCEYWLEEDSEFIWLCRPFDTYVDYGQDVVEQNILTLFIEVVRTFLGDNWTPRKIKVSMQHEKVIVNCHYFKGCHIIYQHPYTGIAVEKDKINNVKTTAFKTKVTKNEPLEIVPKGLENTLFVLLEQGYFGSDLSIENVAKSLHLSERSLQRYLNQNNTSFSMILDNVLYSQSKQLLKNGVSVTDIAAQLNFSTPQNFSRAFKKWSGVAPTYFSKGKLV